MHSDNSADKKIPESVRVETSNNLTNTFDGFSNGAGGIYDGWFFSSNSSSLLIDLVVSL